MKQNTTCPYCGVGCGVTAELSDQRIIAVSGDSQHPANFGRLCIKGSTLHETTQTEQRLLLPRVDGQNVHWSDAIKAVSSRIRHSLENHGPGSIAMYLSGQLLTEDYYVANKLMKGFLGSSHVDTNSRLCMASTVAGHKRAFGSDSVPGCYEDIELADLIILVGSNAAWNHPILFQRIQATKIQRPQVKVVVIDPRATATCELADLHLAIKPGSDVALFNALLVHLSHSGALDQPFIDQHTEGFERAIAIAHQDIPDLKTAATLTDVPLADLDTFFDWFTKTPRTLTLFSQGVNQSSSGTDKVNSLINCHLATGRIGKPGSSPFSLTGQPNAMGGREVGGLANQLAAHMEFSPEAINRVQDFWNAPSMAQQPGHKALDLFQAIDRGEIKVLWIMATNPLVSLPNTALIRRALKRCDCVIVSEAMSETDTLTFADIQLPSSTWGEKNGTVTNSERRISRQKGLIKAPGEARHDWEIICDVAKALGFEEGFNFTHPAQIFAEHAALSGFQNTGQRSFDISGLSHLSQQEYDQLQPVQWPINQQFPYGRKRLFDDGQFSTPSGKAQFIATETKAPKALPSAQWPYQLNTGRIRDQWHTMTRTGRAARLFNHRAEPFLDLHPEDAKHHNLHDQDLAELSNHQGRYIGRVRISAAQRKGEVFIPMHWNQQFSGDGYCNALLEGFCDPVSGQPESKQGAVALRAYPAQWHAQLLIKDHTELSLRGYWTKIPMRHSTQFLLADTEQPNSWMEWCRQHLGQAPDSWVQTSSGEMRAMAFDQDRLHWVLLISPSPIQSDPTSVDMLFSKPALTPAQRNRVLNSQQGAQATQIICSCHQVTEASIKAAIEKGCHTVDSLKEKLACGTGCGSCIPELSSLLAEEIATLTIEEQSV